jgi:glucose/arabinose dehydrogenase
VRAALAAAFAALFAAAAAPAAAAPALVEVGRFAAPVHAASPPDDPRLFVVEKAGLVRIAGGGTFLDVRALTENVGERGLLSIAFAPDYHASGRFSVFLTDRATGALRVLEYRRSADPGRADPASGRELLRIPHADASNHNGGQLQFGRDGMLYVSTGDGGSTPQTAQDGASLLGKILRIDPLTGAAAAGNPFGTRVWAYGLRNPWRFSFDRATGDMFIGDVGDGQREEIDRLAAGVGGANLGWACVEGTRSTGACPPPAGAVAPIIEHAHADGYTAITGGFVVRDPGLPTLAGRYLYGDLGRATLRSALPDGSGGRDEPLSVPSLVSFGEDGCGRIHAVSISGPVFRLQDGSPSACPVAVTTPLPPVPPGERDTTAPRVRVSIAGLRSAARRRHLRVAVRCSERCRATVATRLRGVRRLATRRRTLRANTRRVVRTWMPRRTAHRLRRTIRRRGPVRVTVTVRATDAAGNARRVRSRARVRR